MTISVGFIGVGNMGFPIAKNIHESGYPLIAYDNNADKLVQLQKLSIPTSSVLSNIVKQSQVIISMVPDDETLLDICLREDGLSSQLGPDQIHIAMSTISPKTTELIANSHKLNNTGFLSSPVLGRPEAADKRRLWVFLSGNQDAKNKCLPLLNVISQTVYDFGENITSASIIKLAANFLIISAIEAMGEASAFLKKNEIDANLFAKMITETLFACPAYRYHAENIANQTFDDAGFKLTLGLKDLNLIKSVAEKSCSPMPIASLLHDRFLQALAKNRGHLDWSAITLGSLEDCGLFKQ